MRRPATGGLRVYDVANIDQKGFSERITTAPFSPLGQTLLREDEIRYGRCFAFHDGGRPYAEALSRERRVGESRR